MNNKKLICIEGRGQHPFDMALFTENRIETYTDNKIKHLIIQRAKHAENEDANQSLEVARFDLTQERALTLWEALRNCDFEKYIFVDISHTPKLELYIAKPRPDSDQRYLIVTHGQTENQSTNLPKAIARFTLTPQRINRLKNLLTEDW